MSPPSGAIQSGCPAAPPASATPDAATPPISAVPDATHATIEQFIWPDSAAPAADAETPPSQTLEDAARVPETQLDHGMALPRIVATPLAEGPEPDERWRRQLISALHDVDRETSPPPAPHATTPPLLPYIAPPRRASPHSLAPSRPSKTWAPVPSARASYHRIGLPLLGAAAIAGLFSTALPRTANTPEAIASPGSPPLVLANPHTAPVADGDMLKPVMFNAPVLVREGVASIPDTAPRPPRVIEARRADPAQHNHEHPSREATPPVAAHVAQPAAPAAAPAPAPAAAPPPLDRDGLTALVTRPPTPSPQASASTPPPALHRQAAVGPPRADASSSRRAPQISTSYERTIPERSRRSSRRAAHASGKTAARPQRTQWDTRRHGLRTTPPPEPSTLQKIVNWVWPSSTSEAKPQAKQPGPSAASRGLLHRW